jgi:hypothetical protein
LIATVLPVGAEDNNASSSSSPVNGTGIVSIHVGAVDITISLLSLPIRCGNNC